jgi:hypothetical protein
MPTPNVAKQKVSCKRELRVCISVTFHESTHWGRLGGAIWYARRSGIALPLVNVAFGTM